MKCEFCGEPLDEGKTICPECNEKLKKKQNAAATKGAISAALVLQILAAAVVIVLLLAVLVFAVIYGITGKLPYDMGKKETTAATETPETTTALGTVEDLGLALPEIVDIATYTDEAMAKAKRGEVITQLGDYQLSNSMLQVFYWTEFANFVVSAANDGADLVSTYNLDIYSPLHTQKLAGYDVTWEQYFLHAAIQSWLKYAVVNTMADEAGFEMTQESLDTLAKVPETMAEEAVKDGYANVEALMDDRLGTPCDLEDYVNYMHFTARGDLYYSDYLAKYEPTDAEVEEFYELNAEYYEYYGYSKESGRAVSVRHALLQPEGCEFDDTGSVVATDEQWEACRAEAQAMLDAWVKAGATEAGFAELANAHSADGGSNTTGGLYENVIKGQMVQAFDAWCFDETRQPGNYGLVKTEFGYHLMYFVSTAEEEAWFAKAKADAISYGYGFNMEVSERMNSVTPEFALDKICLGEIHEEKPAETPATEPSVPANTTAATE